MIVAILRNIVLRMINYFYHRAMENKNMKTAIYIRVSTEDQAKEGYSLEVQREYLEAFAKGTNGVRG